MVTIHKIVQVMSKLNDLHFVCSICCFKVCDNVVKGTFLCNLAQKSVEQIECFQFQQSVRISCI